MAIVYKIKVGYDWVNEWCLENRPRIYKYFKSYTLELQSGVFVDQS